MTLIRFKASQEQDVDLRRTYDAVVVGSGAAGGMAAHVLTAQGMKVLLLEAGKKIPIEQELRSMEWPYDHPRRGEAPPGYHAVRYNEYTVRQPPYAKGSAFKHVFSYVGGWGGSDYVKNILVDEKDHPYTGTRYAWVRARTRCRCSTTATRPAAAPCITAPSHGVCTRTISVRAHRPSSATARR